MEATAPAIDETKSMHTNKKRRRQPLSTDQLNKSPLTLGPSSLRIIGQMEQVLLGHGTTTE
jgi:hypothetical protein